MSEEEPFGHLPDEDPPDDGGDGSEAPTPAIPRRYRGSLAASALAAGMIGLRDILEDPKDSRPVVEQFADDDDGERDVEVHLDPDDPAASTIRFRSD